MTNPFDLRLKLFCLKKLRGYGKIVGIFEAT